MKSWDDETVRLKTQSAMLLTDAKMHFFEGLPNTRTHVSARVYTYTHEHN